MSIPAPPYDDERQRAGASATPPDAADRGRLSRSRALGRRQCGHPVCLDVCRTRSGPARPRAGADARQRSLRRHRARLAARHGFPADARRALGVLCQHRGLRTLRPRGPVRVALCRRGFQPALDRGSPRRHAQDRRSRPRARAAPALRARRLPARSAFDDRSLPPARDGRPAAQGRGARAGAGLPGAHHRRRRTCGRQTAARLCVLRRSGGSAQRTC